MIGSPEYMWDILLADTVELCLLGSEFLHETGCIIEMEKAHLTARDHLTGIQAQQRDYYNRTAREQRFEVGDFSVQTKIGVITKLRPMLYQFECRRSIDVIHHVLWKLCRDRNVPLRMCRKRHQVLDKDVVVSLPVDPADIPKIVSQEYMWDILLT